MTADVSGLISRVIERAIEKYGEQSGSQSSFPVASITDAQRETILIESLSAHLLSLLGVNGNAGGPLKQETTESTRDADLIERNHMLARALGACECWGESNDCRVCFGQGGPGWALPHKSLFDRIVRPALQTVNAHRLTIKKNGVH